MINFAFFFFDIGNQQILLRTHYVQMAMIDTIPCPKEAYILGTQRHMKMSQYCGTSNLKSLLYFGSLSQPLFHSSSHFVLIAISFANQFKKYYEYCINLFQSLDNMDILLAKDNLPR